MVIGTGRGNVIMKGKLHSRISKGNNEKAYYRWRFTIKLTKNVHRKIADWNEKYYERIYIR